jgi:uncharacterized phage-associated protein
MSEWKLSNLPLQKMLYIAHMFHLGKHGTPLINESFEAWDYGPVVPAVYRRVSGFGADPIRNVFHWEKSVPPDTTEYEILREVYSITKGMSPSHLVAISHWDRGAWNQRYDPNTRRSVIPNQLIRDEYRRRVEVVNERKSA